MQACRRVNRWTERLVTFVQCKATLLALFHAHINREGLRSVFPSLGRVRSIRDIQDRIAELARGKAPGEWIVTMPSRQQELGQRSRSTQRSHPRGRSCPLSSGYCCKSRFALVAKYSAGYRRGFRVKMWGGLIASR